MLSTPAMALQTVTIAEMLSRPVRGTVRIEWISGANGLTSRSGATLRR